MIKLNNELYDLSTSRVRRLLHEDLDSLVWDSEEVTEEMEEELAEAHKLISAENEDDLDGFMIGYDIHLEKVVEKVDLKTALIKAGYTVDLSNISRSIYVKNDEGQEARIADHSRPAYEDASGIYHDHEYDNELIVKDNKVTAAELSSYGIELEEGEYYLG